MENLTFETLMYAMFNQDVYRFEVLGVKDGVMDYLTNPHMCGNSRWADPTFWQSQYCFTTTVPFAIRAACSHSRPIDPDRAFKRVSLKDLQAYHLPCLYMIVDKHTFYNGQWGTMIPGTCPEARDHAPNGCPAGQKFYLMPHLLTGVNPIDGVMMELFNDRPKSEEAAKIMQDKLLL